MRAAHGAWIACYGINFSRVRAAVLLQCILPQRINPHVELSDWPNHTVPAGPPLAIADVPFGPGPTFYTMIGDAFDWVCAIFTCWGGGFLILSRKSRRPTKA